MELPSLLLYYHVDLIAFSVLILGALVFCQLVVRSTQIGANLPQRNVLGTLGMGIACVAFTFGISRLYESHQRSILEGVLESVTLDADDLLERPSQDRDVAFTRISTRWRTTFPSLSQLVLAQTSTEGAAKVIKDDGIDLDFDGSISRPGELPKGAGDPLDPKLHRFDSLSGGGLSPYLRTYEGENYLQLAAPIKDEQAVSIVFRASVWTIPVAAARLVTLATGLCCVVLLLSRPLVRAIHSAELARRQSIERSLEQARDAADDENRKKSEMLAALTFEIRTPLTAIMGFSRVLLDSQLEAPQRRHVETIVSAGDRLVGILNDILDLNRLDEGKLQLEEIDYSPVTVLSDLVDLLTPQAARKGLNLRLETTLRESFLTRGDPTRLRQIVLRLVDNALRFTDHGAVTVRAVWRPQPQGQEEGVLVVAIIDTGIGISTERQASLFSAFNQAPDPRRPFTDNGLGLAMVKKLVNLMRGTIVVESSPGSGSTFTLSLPCSPKSTVTQSPHESNTRPPLQRRALVVDDQALNREIVRLMLQRLGYQADTAGSGEDALRMAKGQEYEIIFIDLDMPGLDGFETSQQMRALGGRNRLIPIVAITGVTEKGTRERCLAAGMSEYLTKPVYAPALKSTIAALMVSAVKA